jgi:hypothetical protein
VGVVVDPVAPVQLVGRVGVALWPGPGLRVLNRQVGDGVVVLPVVGIQLEGLGGQFGIV